MQSRWYMRYQMSVAILVVLSFEAFGQVGQVRTIRELQEVPYDSLALMESLGASGARGGMDDTPFAIRNDTVRVTGVVLVKPRILTYTLARYNIFIQDTATGAIWAGLNVLTNDTSDQAKSTDITALDTGDVVTVVGRALEFPTASSTTQENSLTEMFLYNVGTPATFTNPQPIQFLTTIPRPQPRELRVDSFSLGTTPRITVGEKYEGMYVVIRNVTVNSINATDGDFTFVDSAGNQMRMYDGSGYYTLRGHKISGSKYTPLPVGTKLAYIRGIILPQSRSLTVGEYTIMPVYPGPDQLTGSSYPGDIKVDKFATSVTALTRSPRIPKSTDAVSVTFRAKDLNTNSDVDSAFIFYRNAISGSYTRVKITLTAGDSLYRATLPLFANNTYVCYFAGAYSATGFGMFPDSSVAYFFPVRDAGLAVYDIQYTPFRNGNGPFSGDTVTVRGIVTSDTSDISDVPTSGSTQNRPRIWMAQAAGAWRGIAVYGLSASVGLDTVKRGDSITVTGRALESNSRTTIEVHSRVVNATGKVVPAATAISLSGSGSVSYELSNPPTNGNPTFEQWEGVLVNAEGAVATAKVLYLANRNADNPSFNSGSNFGEYMVSATAISNANSRFGLRVNDNGRNSYYADTSVGYFGPGGRWFIDHPTLPPKTNVIQLGWTIASMKAIFDYSFSFYKLEPRKDSDFGAITGVENVSDVPGAFELSQNFPNPFNPTTNIRYTMPISGHVSLKVFNILGQEVATLVNSDMSAGSYVVDFNAGRLATGVYFYQLHVGDFRSIKKMLLVK